MLLVFTRIVHYPIPAFKAFDQSELEYSAPIQAFRRLIDTVDELRGSSSIEEYITQLSTAEIRSLWLILTEDRTLILEGIRQFKQQETDNQTSFLAYIRGIIVDHYNPDQHTKDLAFDKIMNEVMLRQRKIDMDMYKQYSKDTAFRMSWKYSLQQGVMR